MFRILHLSDLHAQESTQWSTTPILNLAKKTILDQANKINIDLVAFTGDIAYSGKKAEYDIAQDWLEDLCLSSSGLPPSLLHRFGRRPCRPQGILHPLRLGLAAFLHQLIGGLLGTPTPVDRQQAEGEIRPADVGPSAFTGFRGIRHAALVARPASRV
jgi:hypothetical protein